MFSIVVTNAEENVLYENIAHNLQELMKGIQEDERSLYLNMPRAVRIKSLIVVTEGDSLPYRTAPSLSKKQGQVIQLLAQACSPEQIALKLDISESTVRMHIRALKKKFKTDSRAQLMAMAGTLGLCDPFETSTIHGQTED